MWLIRNKTNPKVHCKRNPWVTALLPAVNTNGSQLEQAVGRLQTQYFHEKGGVDSKQCGKQESGIYERNISFIFSHITPQSKST